MTDDIDAVLASFQVPVPEEYRAYHEALAAVARHHGINTELLYGSQDQTQPPNEDEFYLRLARAFLILAAHDDEWISPRALAAISAIDVGVSTRKLGKEISERGPLIGQKRAYDVMSNAAKRAVAVATFIVKKSGIPIHRRGRPLGLRADGRRIRDLMNEAGITFSHSWPESWIQLQDYTAAVASRLPTAAKRKQHTKEMNTLLGPTGERARAVYRIIKDIQAKEGKFLAQVFPE